MLSNTVSCGVAVRFKDCVFTAINTFTCNYDDWDSDWYDAPDSVLLPGDFFLLMSSCTDVGIARLRSTLSTVAHRSPMLSAGSVSGQPHSNWWWCHDIGYPLLDAEHLLCTAPLSGTPCRTTSAHSRTISPLDRAWKPGFSQDTTVFSALETFVIIALYKSTFTIPYHTIIKYASYRYRSCSSLKPTDHDTKN